VSQPVPEWALPAITWRDSGGKERGVANLGGMAWEIWRHSDGQWVTGVELGAIDVHLSGAKDQEQPAIREGEK